MYKGIVTNIAKAAMLFLFVFVITICAAPGGISSQAAKRPAVRATGLIIANAKTKAQKKVIEPKRYIFIGDSRFVGMEASVTDNPSEVYIAKVSMGLKWFKQQMQGLTFNDNDILIIGFGINDLHNIDQYIPYINGINAKNVYWLTVNPVDEVKQAKQKYPLANATVCDFNNKMKAGASEYKVIDTYNALMSHGFYSIDGAHYDDITYSYIHDYVVGEIKQDLA